MTTQATKTSLKGVLMLLLTALIWGSSFVAQSVGMESVEAFTFNGIRTLMGAAVLTPFVLIRDGLDRRRAPERYAARAATYRRTILCGIPLGIVLCLASNFQQFAFNYSTSGKIAFVTALYMFLVPIFGLVIRKRVPALTWLCVVMGFIGLGFLCVNPQDLSSINFGDILAGICAVFYAVQILMVERFSERCDGVMLSLTQFVVSGVLSCLLMFLTETPEASAIRAAMVPMLYSGVLSCGVAYTLQIVGQKYTEATVASLIMCLESVFGVLCGAIVLHEVLSVQEITGCVIMFAAIVLSQLADRIRFGRGKRKVEN
ncbi:MAG: DMT family transporter [Ruminococcaceae bacterium]|nr:DMT family transporter [Oscillospiraceae bacterium]